MIASRSHEFYMKEALKEAQKAILADEIPVGAIVVCNDQIIARSLNFTEKLKDVTAHAEMLVFTSASDYLGGKYLNECTLYVTLEPCLMCAGASYWTRIGTLVFGASDSKRGYRSKSVNGLHPKTKLVEGVLEKECTQILKDFFGRKRELK